MKPLEDLIATQEQVRELLSGSHVSGDRISFELWREHRQPIVRAIHQAGSILDIGCANGFLLRCLLEWSEHELDPYGIEPDEALLAQCKKLFPSHEHHFAPLTLRELHRLHELGLPTQYSFVYWNVWDNFSFADTRFEGWLEQADGAVAKGGRLILGFYNSDRTATEKEIAWLDRHYRPIQHRYDNQPHDEVFLWWDV